MNSNVVVEFLALNSAVLPKRKALLQALEEFGIQQEHISDFKEDESIVSFLYRKGVCVLKLIESPISWSSIENACGGSSRWPEALEKMKAHRSHIIVTWFDRKSTLVEKYLSLTRIMAALASVCDSLGVYWGAGALVHQADLFITECKNIRPDYVPLPLWVDFRVEESDAGGFLMKTTGMEALGQREILVRKPAKTASEAYNIAFNLARHSLEYGSAHN